MIDSLDILIPARNEMFLKQTVDDILSMIEGPETQIIVVCDGNWPDPPIEDNPRLRLIYHSKSIGQRAAVNEAAKLSKAKYLMKVDAHCSFDKGFDVKLMADMQDDWTMVPVMRNLWVFDWVCKKCGDRRYQGNTPVDCPKCDNKTDFYRDIVWIAKTNPQSTSYCFDTEPHFQYFVDYKRRPEGKGDITETMSLQGSCFLVTRDKFFELELCDENLGSWGSQGIEVAVKTWLSGGRVVCNHKTWYGHLFRTKGGDFGFPYNISGRQIQNGRRKVKELFFDNKWPKQIHPLSWLVEKFWPVHCWTKEDLDNLKSSDFTKKRNIDKVTTSMIKSNKEPEKGLVYYTDFTADERILNVVRKQITKCCPDWPIVSVSLNKPLDWGENIVLNGKRSYLMMFKQILAGIEASKADVLFMVEHDVLYHPSHFQYKISAPKLFYYNENRWAVNYETGHALFYHTKATSMMCAKRELLLEHYKKRVDRVEKEGYSFKIGFEPGGHQFPRGIDEYKLAVWWSEFPCIDIRHGKNLTASRWTKEEFRNKRNLHSWTESNSVPGWGKTEDGGLQEILSAI